MPNLLNAYITVTLYLSNLINIEQLPFFYNLFNKLKVVQLRTCI